MNKYFLPVTREVTQRGYWTIEAKDEEEARELFNNGHAYDFVEEDFEIKSEEQGKITCEERVIMSEDLIRMDAARKAAIGVMATFEAFLEEHNITIPSADREGNEEEARIYGSEYYALEDEITEWLSKCGLKGE
ncbi:MAG: hypothetical protein WC307_05995 [Candidatus Nanoarchaeia archaeon]